MTLCSSPRRLRRARPRSWLVPVWLAAALWGCGGGDSPTGPGVAINGIPVSEIERVPPPSYDALSAAFDRVVAADPTLRQSSPRLARAVFDEIKRQGASAARRERAPDVAAAGVGVLLQLTWDEWKVLIGDPLSGYAARNAPGLANLAGQSTFPCDAPTGYRDDRADAVRHAYWNAVMARRIAAEYGVAQALAFTEKFTTAHESGITDQSPLADRRAKAMDLSNHAAGRRVFMENPSATEDQLLQLVLALPFVYVEGSDAVTRDDRRLVYLTGQQPFDGSMSGTMSNPDSGGPWEAVFSFTQCNSTIRGSFSIVRGGASQKRRFSGSVGGAAMALNIAAPFAYENPDNLTICTGMTATLGGSRSALSGSWRSSNCTQGGRIELRR